MAGSRAHTCKHKSRVRLQQEHTEHRKHCSMPLSWSVVPQVVEACFWVQMMKKLKEIQKYSLGSTRQRQKMWINKFSFQKKICLGKMSSMRDVSNFHEKILGPPLYIVSVWLSISICVVEEKHTERKMQRNVSVCLLPEKTLWIKPTVYIYVFSSPLPSWSHPSLDPALSVMSKRIDMTI